MLTLLSVELIIQQGLKDLLWIFLRYYFENNVAHLEKFLFKSFWIPFKDNDIQDNEDVIWSFNSPSNLFTITSTQNRVVRTKNI